MLFWKIAVQKHLQQQQSSSHSYLNLFKSMCPYIINYCLKYLFMETNLKDRVMCKCVCKFLRTEVVFRSFVKNLLHCDVVNSKKFPKDDYNFRLFRLLGLIFSSEIPISSMKIVSWFENDSIYQKCGTLYSSSRIF